MPEIYPPPLNVSTRNSMPLSLNTTITQQLSGEIEFGILAYPGASVYWLS
jgi:hypothetical protein